jgi:ferredoxin
VSSALRIVVDPTACQGRGLCAELFPERIGMDAFGYPVVSDDEVGPELVEHARRAAAMCPQLALHLVKTQATALRSSR